MRYNINNDDKTRRKIVKKSNNIRLTDIRKERCYTQAYLAELLGVTQSTVAMWESGATVPAMKRIIALAELFGKTVDEICACFRT